MKRIISCFLSILLLVSVCCQAVTVSALDDEPTFAVSSEQGHPGEHVTVVIRMENNPGIASIKLKVQFDDGLTLQKITYHEALGGKFQQPQTMTSPVTLNWFNGAENTTGDMTYAELDFVVASDASVGEHAVSITYDANDVYNISEDNITFRIVNGGVNVTIPVIGLALDHTTATVSTGDLTYQLTPVFDPATATNQNVTWSSSDPTIATVDAGLVTILRHGEVVITAVSEEGGFEATCTLTVLCSHLHQENIPAVSSTCTQQGHLAYTICNDCGEILSGSADLLPLAAHQYGNDTQEKYLKTVANCISPAIYYQSCSVCGAQGEQTFSVGVADPDHHVGTTHLENHADASCTHAGYTGDVICDSCLQLVTEGTVINQLAHTPATPVEENVSPATCTQAGGYDKVVYCSSCGGELSREWIVVLATGHSYGEPVWMWNGFDSATATFTCGSGDDEQHLTATITSAVTKEPTGRVEGERTYTAKVTFNGKEYTDTKTEAIPVRILLGDVDGDGRVTIFDASAVQKSLAHMNGYPDYQTLAVDDLVFLVADVDADKKVTIFDASVIQKWLAHVASVQSLGIGDPL